MNIVVPEPIEGTETRIYGKSQRFLGLPVRHGMKRIDLAGGEFYHGPVNVTAWQPTPEELAALNAGASIYVELNTDKVIPMLVCVGNIPDVL